MAAAEITKATIWEDGDVTEMARFEVNGTVGVQAVVTSIQRTIFNVTDGRTQVSTDAIVVAASVFNALQTDGRWTEDSTGYNFRDRIAATQFATGGKTYRVEYLFTGSAGEKFWLVYEHYVREVFSS